MRILQVCHRYYPNIGGVEDHVKNISERLTKKHRVVVFTTHSPRELEKKERINDVSVRRFSAFSPQGAYHFSFEMIKALKNTEEFNIVHGHNYHAFPFLFSQLAKGEHFVVTPHYHRQSPYFFRNFLLDLYYPFGKKVLERAERIICVSNYEKRILIEDLGKNIRGMEEKCIVVPNGIDPKEFDNLSLKGDGNTILYVGRLEKYKGIRYIIKALAKLEDLRLEIVGQGPYRNKLLRLVRKFGLDKRVTFYDFLKKEEVVNKYASASLFISLSKYEAYGITVGEALAAGTPCIVANEGGLSEWIDGKNCFGINYPIEVDKLKKMIGKTIGKNVNTIKLLSWDDVVKRLEDIYRLCGEGG